MTGIAMANYAAPQINGHSIAFDGMPFREDSSSRDTLIIEAGESEGIFLATFDVDALRAYRKREVWGDAYRKPSAYGPMAGGTPLDVFKRADSRR
jgi:predicted amidohydrolase